MLYYQKATSLFECLMAMLIVSAVMLPLSEKIINTAAESVLINASLKAVYETS